MQFEVSSFDIEQKFEIYGIFYFGIWLLCLASFYFVIRSILKGNIFGFTITVKTIITKEKSSENFYFI